MSREWWQHSAGVVTRFWSNYDPPNGPDIYASERAAIHAARTWLKTEMNRLQSRARALDRRDEGEEQERVDG